MSDAGNGRQPDPTRRTLLALLGGSASVGLAGCSALLDDGTGDGDTPDGGDTPDTGNGGDATAADTPESQRTEADKAQAAWERIENNPGPEAEALRTEAFVDIEEAVRDSAIALTFMHDVAEYFSYDHVDVPKSGTLGWRHQQYHTTTVEGDTELNLINSTHNYIDPIESDDEASSRVITQIYERLVEYPNGVPEMENQLLSGFQVSDDGLTYTFTLKEGVPFHGGGEVTASDVAYSWRRVAESPNSVRSSFLLSSSTGVGIEHETDDEGDVVPDSLALEVVDDYTLEMTIQNPSPSVMDVLTYTSFSVIPEGIVGDVEGYDGEVDHQEFRNAMADGTGPFQFDSFELDEEFRATRFEDYHRETAAVESIHWEIVEDSEARFTYAMERNADVFTIPTGYYDPDLVRDTSEDDRGRTEGAYGPVENGETLQYLAVSELVTRYFGFNARHVPPAVRKAFAYVLDQEEIVNEVFAGRAVPAYSFTPPGIFPGGRERFERFREEYPYSANETDLEGARDVLSEAGYSADEPFDLECTVYAGSAYADAAGLLRDKLSGNGVSVDVQEAQFATIQERGYDGDLEMYSLGWSWSWQSVAYGHFSFEPRNTDTAGMPEVNSGYYFDWQVELEEEA